MSAGAGPAASPTIRHGCRGRSLTASISASTCRQSPAADLILPAPAELSAEVAKRVAAARTIQRERYLALGHPNISTNAQCASSLIEQVAAPDAAAMALLKSAAEAMHLSARGYHRVLKVARTLADLDGADSVGRIHLAEALSYRAVGDRLAAAAA